MADELKQIDDVREQLQDLRKQVQAGSVYQSLAPKLTALLEALPQNDAQPVTLPDDDDGIVELLTSLREQMQAATLDMITDKQLLKLINHLGSPSSDIRDYGVYYFFNDALQQQVLTDDQMRLAMNALLQDKVLFSHITEPENDGVFGRSFAVMILSVLAYADRVGYQFMSAEMSERLVVQLMTYMALENDTRGFVGEKGWAHAYTHIGNLLDELADSKTLARADKIFLMDELLVKYQHLSSPLIFGEDRRLAAYLATLINTNDLYAQAFLQTWRQWRVQLRQMNQPQTEGEWTKLFNRSRLLSSLLLRDDLPSEVTTVLLAESDFMA
ncbi:hypothetical protein LSI01_10140 [Furfurilactobacillus siliginis]|nr:hypothetical protein LSI01_10140 [Furfurilactobacillus siliginis]